jgi:hypothetical protein
MNKIAAKIKNGLGSCLSDFLLMTTETRTVSFIGKKDDEKWK